MIDIFVDTETKTIRNKVYIQKLRKVKRTNILKSVKTRSIIAVLLQEYKEVGKIIKPFSYRNTINFFN